MKSLDGVIVSLVTPFSNDEIDFEKINNNIIKLNRTAVTGYLALGGNAESNSLTEKERIILLKNINDLKEDKILIAGINSESNKITMKYIEKYEKLGVDYIRLVPPHYFPYLVDESLLEDYYLQIADNSPIPIILYNAPKLTGGVLISSALAGKLSEHKMIHGIKDSSLTELFKYVHISRSNSNFKILAGSASFFFPSLIAGASGGDMTAANYIPEICCCLFDFAKNENYKEGKELHARILRVNSFISGKWGFCGVKAAMNLMGFDGGEPRLPYRTPSGKDIVRIEKILFEEGFLH